MNNLVTIAKKKLNLIIISLFIFINPAWCLAYTSLQNEFIAYEKKIDHRQITSEQEIPNKLKKYSLYPYLELELIKNKLAANPFDQITYFYAKHKNSPVSKKLNYYVISYLSNKERWQDIIQYYIPNSNYLIKCLYFSALQKTDPDKIGMKDVTELWLTSENRPKRCNQLFSVWIDNKIISQELIWQRVNLAIEKHNPDLVLSLSKYLPYEDNENLKLWYRVDKNSNLITHTQLFDINDPFHHKIIIAGLKNEAAKNIDKSLRYYRELNQKFKFSDINKYDYYSFVATKMFLRDHEHTESLIEEIPLKYYDEALHTIAIKSALKNMNWDLVTKRINKLPAKLQKKDIWIYWLARAQEELKHNEVAKALYNMISNKVNYYGILACRNLKSACPIEFAITTPFKKDKVRLLHNPGINRAIELFKINRQEQARLEWNDAIKNLNDKQKFVAAMLANDLNWHDRTITTMALYEKENDQQEANNFDNAMLINLKYPMGYKNNILKFSKKYQVDPAWMFAISRQESAFMPAAKSRAGALGLMQLMPATAKQLARHNKISYHNDETLLNEATNIHLGAAYLQQMLSRYNGNSVFATAAYNAGPTQVRKWIKANKSMHTDIWIELIPFYETRDYLKTVLTNTAVYRSKLSNAHLLMNTPVNFED